MAGETPPPIPPLPPSSQSTAPPSLHSPFPTTAKIRRKQLAAGAVLGVPLPPASGEVGVVLQSSGEVGGEPKTSGEVGVVLHSSGEVGGEPKTSGDGELPKTSGDGKLPRKTRKKKNSEACGVQKITTSVPCPKKSEACGVQNVTTSVPCPKKSEKKVTITNSGNKRPLSEGGVSSRASKAAKIVDSKVDISKLQNKCKAVVRKIAPIVSGSPMINRMARQREHSHAMPPNLVGTSKVPSIHDLSPAAATSIHRLSPDATNGAPTYEHDLSPAATNGAPTYEHDLSPAATNGSKRRPRKLTSKIWNDAEPIYVDGLLMQGRCKYCTNIFPASKVSGTSQLGRHLKVCEVKNSMDVVIKQIKTSEEINPDWKFDQRAARRELVDLIVLHRLPFTFVEYSGFRKFCAALNPWFKSLNRVTIQNDCLDAYHDFRTGYEDFFKNCNHRVSLTGDMWSSNQKLGYLCITCHWIDKNWKMNHRIIRFCLVETPHDAWNMFGVVLDSLRDFNIEDKLYSFTLDNAEVNTKMVDHLRKNLVDRDLLHHEGKLLHVRCAAHVLNLIVQDGLKAMKSVVDNVRESVKFIKSSQSRKEQFDKLVAKIGIKCKHHPSLDVSTRWNSTFLMLESTLPFRKVFETLVQEEPNYTVRPSDQEWIMVEDICQLLKAIITLMFFVRRWLVVLHWFSR